MASAANPGYYRAHLRDVGATQAACTTDNPALRDIATSVARAVGKKWALFAPEDFPPRIFPMLAPSPWLEIPAETLSASPSQKATHEAISKALEARLLRPLIKTVLAYHDHYSEQSRLINFLVRLRKKGGIVPDRIPRVILNPSTQDLDSCLGALFEHCNVATLTNLARPASDQEGFLVVAKGKFASKKGKRFVLIFDFMKGRCLLRATEWSSADDSPKVADEKPLPANTVAALLLAPKPEKVARILQTAEIVCRPVPDAAADEGADTDSDDSTVDASDAAAISLLSFDGVGFDEDDDPQVIRNARAIAPSAPAPNANANTAAPSATATATAAPSGQAAATKK